MPAPHMSYLGFRATPEGREYRVMVYGPPETRTYVVFIGHDVFASGAARFQDAPDLCFSKLRRALDADPDLDPQLEVRLSRDELTAYRTAHVPAPQRRRSAP